MESGVECKYNGRNEILASGSSSIKVKRSEPVTNSEAATTNVQSDPGKRVPARNLGRSIGAIGGGAVVGNLLTLGTDAVFSALGVLPNAGQSTSTQASLLAAAYRCDSGLVGS